MNLDHARTITDFNGLTALKTQARDDRAAAVGEVARQFESLFIQMALERMREASFGGGLLDSDQSLFYRDLYDKQLAMSMSNAGGIGLAAAIERQLSDTAPTAGGGRLFRDYQARPTPSVTPAPDGAKAPDQAASGTTGPFEGRGDFLRKLRPAAEAAAVQLGVAPEALLAQAALETGWGRHVMPRADGGSSHNLFGIKADARWAGDKVVKSTLEFRDGVAVRERAAFRAYGSYEESFADYAAFIQGNPRYRDALAAAEDPHAYLAELQKAGYATDPAYANKIRAIMHGEVISGAAQPVKDRAVVPM
jgi:flagellar protein FlgJ